MELFLECELLEVNLEHYPVVLKEIGPKDDYAPKHRILDNAKVYHLLGGFCITGDQRIFEGNWHEIKLPNPNVDINKYEESGIKERTELEGWWWNRHEITYKYLSVGYLLLKERKPVTIELNSCSTILIRNGIKENL